jgi:DNA invertase Pin-like site-specific DNA recombinase
MTQELREYARRRDWPAPQEITDTISGAKSSREGLDRLLKQVRRGQVDCVLVHALVAWPVA